MTNTEKPTTQAESKKQGIVQTPKQIPQVEKQKPVEKKKEETKTEDKKTKEPSKQKPVAKKTEVGVNSSNIPVSTKYSMAICKFIKNKKIEKAIRDLQEVILLKKAVPMKGEIPHRKGKGIMSGRFPVRAARQFVILLKSLQGNAMNHSLEEPIISEAIANIGVRPFGRFGRVRKKRTHITIKAKSKVNKKGENKN